VYWLCAVLHVHLVLTCSRFDNRFGRGALVAAQDLFQRIPHGQKSAFALAIVDVAAVPLGFDESRLPEDSQVLGDSALGNAQARRDRPHAQGLLFEQAQDLDARANRDGLETAGQNLHLLPHGRLLRILVSTNILMVRCGAVN
jgi:hypothetical protein